MRWPRVRIFILRFDSETVEYVVVNGIDAGAQGEVIQHRVCGQEQRLR